MKKESETPERSATMEFKLADLWRSRGKIDRAVDGLLRVIERQPDYLPAYLEVVQLFQQHHQYDLAIAWCRRAIEQHPHEPGLHQQLAKLLLLQDGPDEQTAGSARSNAVKQGQVQAQSSGQSARLLIYTDCSDTFGVEQWNHSLMCGLQAMNYHVTCAQGLADNHLVRQQQAAGIGHVWITADDLYDPSRTPAAFSNWPQAESVFSACKPDLILFSSGSPVSDLAAKEVAARLRIPYVIVAHCVTSSWSRQFDSYIERLRDIHARARAVVTVSRHNLELMHKYFRLLETHGEVIFNGVRPVFFAATEIDGRQRLRQELGISDDAIVVLTVARLAQTKGYHYLLEVAAILRQDPLWPRLRFVWVGSGSFESRLRVVADELGVMDKIQFLGERSDIPELLGIANIFALTSQFEGMPLAVMEAMAKGLPVMAANAGGVPEQMGETGKLLPPIGNDPQALIQAAARTLAHWAGDEAKRQHIGQQARKRALALFREERMLSAYARLIESSLERQ